MSFLYPRTISVRRPKPNTAGTAGVAKPYGGLAPKDETVIVTGLPANIQFDRQGTQPDTNLPGGARGSGSWKVFIPKRAAALGSIQRNDVIVDDLGTRYIVAHPYWNSLGYALRVQGTPI